MIQPKFVLPEFFMHVQFPRVDRAAAAPSVAGGSTVVPPMLATAPGAGNRRDAASRSPASAPKDSVFPLENLLLQNAVCELEEKSTRPGLSKVEYEIEAGAGGEDSTGESSNISPQQTLLRKQAIVESLQRAVQDFKRERDGMLMNYVKGLAGKLDL